MHKSTDPHLLWIWAVPIDAMSLRSGEPGTDAQRQTHQTHQIHSASSPQEPQQVQLASGNLKKLSVVKDLNA